MVDEAASLIFDEQLVEPAMMFMSSRLESVWWLPQQNCQVELHFSNTTDLPLPVSLAVKGMKPEQNIPLQITLQPHETRMASLQDLLADRVISELPETAGISIEHQGKPGALLARGMVQDRTRGYSSAIQFVDPANMRTRRLYGTGLRIGQIDGDELRPVVAARNIGHGPVVISGKMPFTAKDGRIDVLPIKKIRLRAGESQILPLQPALRRRKPEEIALAGLKLNYKGEPGTVIMSALSMSASGNQVCHVPMLDPGAQKSSTGGYPWLIEDSSSTAVYIMNTTDRTQHYTAYLKVEGDNYVIGTKAIEPGHTATYDIRALRDNQVKDRDGRIIPIDAKSGQFYWSIIQAEEGLTQWYMIGRAEQIDPKRAMSSSYACQNCCNIRVADYGISPSFASAVAGDKVIFSAWQDNYDCNGNIYPSDPVIVSWSSNDNSIAKMNGNVATAKNGGAVTIKAQWNASQTSPPANPDCGGTPAGVPPPVKPNLPNPCSCTTAPLHLTATATLFVQVPKYFNARSVQNADLGCNAALVGYGAQVEYQVLDQNKDPIQMAGMTPLELVTIINPDGSTSRSNSYQPFSTPVSTRSDGTFTDIPVGTCRRLSAFPGNVAFRVTQLFRLTVTTQGSSTTYDITTITFRRDCAQGIKVGVQHSASEVQTFTFGTVN